MKFDLSTFAVRRWQFTLVAFGLLVMLGVNAFTSIPRSEDPHFPIPIVFVRAVLPGAEPSEMEQLVVDPIEDGKERIHRGVHDLMRESPRATSNQVRAPDDHLGHRLHEP